jgi:hypothetical protein
VKKLTPLAFGLLLLGACTKPAEVIPPPPPPKPPAVIASQVPQMPAGHPDLPALKVSSRGPRRMSVDQLERSLDNIGNVPAGTVKLPVDLAFTLGRPDFRRVTEESLDPSPLFMKFMVDLSVFFCDSMAEAEATRMPEARVFTRELTIDANLQGLLLRFTGIEGEDARPYLTRLRTAYDAGTQSTKKLGGYQAACMSLFNSPEFLLY